MGQQPELQPALRTTVASTAQRGLAPGRRWAVWLLAAGLSAGCGIPGGAEGSATLVSGLPKCDPSLLHPRVTVGAAAGLPGKLIVYVDGVMACIDDATRVDQLLPQIDGHAPIVAATAARPAP